MDLVASGARQAIALIVGADPETWGDPLALAPGSGMIFWRIVGVLVTACLTALAGSLRPLQRA